MNEPAFVLLAFGSGRGKDIYMDLYTCILFTICTVVFYYNIYNYCILYIYLLYVRIMLSLNWIVCTSYLQCSFAAHAGGPNIALSAHSARGRLASPAQVNFTDAMVSIYAIQFQHCMHQCAM